MAHYTHVQAIQLPQRSCRKFGLIEVAVMVMRIEIKTIEFWRAVISECLGTFFYVLLGCSSTLYCDHPRDVSDDSDQIVVALCFGLAMATLVQCFGHISGAHFNPVTTLAMTLTCKITPLRGFLYTIAQVGGGIAGAALLYGIVPEPCRHDLGVTSVHHHLSKGQAIGIEVILTFILIFTIFATIDPNRKELGSKPLAIGLAVSLCHLAGYRYTNSSLNPARSLGPAFVTNRWDCHWIYWVGPFGGGVTAGLLYEYIFDPSRRRKPPQAPPSVDIEEDNENDEYHLAAQNRVLNPFGFPPTGRRAIQSYMSVIIPEHSGLENEAYSYDTHPRRHAHPRRMPSEVTEEILLNDVRVEPLRNQQK